MSSYQKFDYSIPYRILPSFGAQPALDVQLSLGPRKTETLGILDSGAMLTVFDEFIAKRLGISDIHEGHAVDGLSLGGQFQFFMFDVEMVVLLGRISFRFPAQVGFCPGYQRRNILGRNLVFSHFVVGFHEQEQMILLQHED